MRIIILNVYAFFLLLLIPVSLFSQASSLGGIENNNPLVLTCGLVVSSIPCGMTPDFGIPIVVDEFDPFVRIAYTDIIYPGFSPQEYSVTRVWTATDNCGNTDVCSRTIFVEVIVTPVMKSPFVLRPDEEGTALNSENAEVFYKCDALVLIAFNAAEE